MNGGEAKFELTIDPNIIIPDGARTIVEEDYVGGWVGGGGTVALGWRELFWMADSNATWAVNDGTDSTILAVTFSSRAGWRKQLGDLAFSLWAGTMYMNYKQTIDISVEIEDIGIFMELDIEGVDPWNMLIGGSLDIGKNWQIMLEGGFIGRSQVVGMASFRF